MKRLLRALPLMVLILLATSSAHAISLSSLMTGGSLTAGETLFDQWALVSYGTSDGARSFNADNIDVTALTDGGMSPGPGLKFNVSNSELTVTGDGIYAYVDLMFVFRASVLDPMLRIKDNSLQYSPAGASWTVSLDGSYDVGSYIREDIYSNGLADLGTKNIEFSRMEDQISGVSEISKISDSATFAPQSEIYITKNLLVWAADTTDSAGIYGFEQRFSQEETAPVPEPSTILLLGGGLLAFVAMRRRKAKA